LNPYRLFTWIGGLDLMFLCIRQSILFATAVGNNVYILLMSFLVPSIIDLVARCGGVTTMFLRWRKPRSYMPWKNIPCAL
jgi:hypothetical protein